MHIKRTLPPVTSQISVYDIFRGFRGLLRGQSEIDKLRQEFKECFNIKNCFFLSSGKAALTLILNALKSISPNRDEVLIPAFTCYSVPSAIVRAGLKVRLTDVNPDTLDFDFIELQRNLKSKNRLLAVVCPHLFGLPSEIDRINEIIDDPQIFVIEDAAQAMGGLTNKRKIGTIGDVGFFSLGRGKAFSTVEGGVIVTNSRLIAEELKSNIIELKEQTTIYSIKLAVYALMLAILTHPTLFWIPKSIAGLRLGETIYDPQFSIQPFSPFQAGLAWNWQKQIISLQKIRKQNVLCWKKVLSKFSWLQPIPIKNESEVLPLLRLPVLVKTASLRNAVFKVSEKEGLGIMPSYPNSIDTIGELDLKSNEGSFPGAKECACRLITFPVHRFVSPKNLLVTVNNLKSL